MDAPSTPPSKRQFARLIHAVGLVAALGLAAPASAETKVPPPRAAQQPAQQADQNPAQPKRGDLRLALQTRDKTVPPRQLSAEERLQMRAQIREMGRSHGPPPQVQEARR